MLRVAVVLYLLCSTAVLAGQATGQFQVGITITGKSRSPIPSANSDGATANAAALPFRAKAGRAPRIGYCSWMHPSFNPATATYRSGDGSIHRCE
jgi:hypothetical protein